MKDFEYISKKYLFEKYIILRPWRLFKFNRFLQKNGSFILLYLKLPLLKKRLKNV